MSGRELGKWHVDGHNLAAVIRCVRERGNPEARHTTGDYETVARCEGPDWAANASAIAALPELLEAVKARREAVEHAMALSAATPDGQTPSKAAMDHSDKLYARADRLERSALAKAEGPLSGPLTEGGGS